MQKVSALNSCSASQALLEFMESDAPDDITIIKEKNELFSENEYMYIMAIIGEAITKFTLIISQI